MKKEREREGNFMYMHVLLFWRQCIIWSIAECINFMMIIVDEWCAEICNAKALSYYLGIYLFSF